MAHVTHSQLQGTFHLPIIGVKKNPSSPLYTQLGVITKGTILEVGEGDSVGVECGLLGSKVLLGWEWDLCLVGEGVSMVGVDGDKRVLIRSSMSMTLLRMITIIVQQ